MQPEDTPRMRTSTFDDYLTSGIAYAFHPRRDIGARRVVPGSDQLVREFDALRRHP